MNKSINIFFEKNNTLERILIDYYLDKINEKL